MEVGASLWWAEERRGDEKTLAGADFITVAGYREEKSWLEVWVGLGSMGVVFVDGKDTKILYSKEGPLGCVGWVGKQRPDW